VLVVDSARPLGQPPAPSGLRSAAPRRPPRATPQAVHERHWQAASRLPPLGFADSGTSVFGDSDTASEREQEEEVGAPVWASSRLAMNCENGPFNLVGPCMGAREN
jgi:hypothetical protein